MKKIMLMITMISTLAFNNANAGEAVVGLGIGTGIALTFWYGGPALATTTYNSCRSCRKEALQIVEDAQNYVQSGELSLFLGQKIKDVQTTNESLSNEEALDSLITNALIYI